jgi:cellobiose phosphorylase
MELVQLINPIRHDEGAAGVERYQVEPYVIAGDVYSRSPHAGRGGWTWYTGSAAWLVRVILESILGVQRVGEQLTLDPCIPPEWPQFEVDYRFRSASYRITVENPHGAERGIAALWLDDERVSGDTVPLVDDGKVHHVRALIGPA